MHGIGGDFGRRTLGADLAAVTMGTKKMGCSIIPISCPAAQEAFSSFSSPLASISFSAAISGPPKSFFALSKKAMAKASNRDRSEMTRRKMAWTKASLMKSA